MEEVRGGGSAKKAGANSERCDHNSKELKSLHGQSCFEVEKRSLQNEIKL